MHREAEKLGTLSPQSQSSVAACQSGSRLPLEQGLVLWHSGFGGRSILPEAPSEGADVRPYRAWQHRVNALSPVLSRLIVVENAVNTTRLTGAVPELDLSRACGFCS